MKTFEFVVSNGAPERPSASVRSHAVKSGLQRKNKAAIPSGPKDAQLTIRQKNNLKGRFRLTDKASTAKTSAEPSKNEEPTEEPQAARVSTAQETKPDRSTATGCIVDYLSRQDNSALLKALVQDGETPSQSYLCGRWELTQSPSQGRGDPFNTLTVHQNSDVDRLMKFFIARFDLEVAMMHVHRQWWGYAISEPLVMHTTLGVAAATWAMYVRKPSSMINEGVKQKSKALRCIQERLGNHDDSNALVGAIANLATMEGIEGAYAVARVHLRGLSLLIKKRGGYKAFKADILIARAVNWADLQAAAGLDTKPLFSIIIPLDSISLPASVLAAAEKPSLSHLRVFETNGEDTTVRFNFALLRQAHHALMARAVSPDDLLNLINAVDHQLATSLADRKLSERSRLMLTAARLFVWVVIRENHAICNIPRLVTVRLKEQLQAGLAHLSASQEHWHGLLWCLTVGSACAYENGEEWDYFSTALSSTLQMAQIQEWTELDVISKRFLWDESLPGKFLEMYGSNLLTSSVEGQE